VGGLISQGRVAYPRKVELEDEIALKGDRDECARIWRSICLGCMVGVGY